MNTYGSLHFAAPSEQAAESKMRLNGIGIHFQHLGEHFNGLVLLLIQQVIDATKIFRRKPAITLASDAPLM